MLGFPFLLVTLIYIAWKRSSSSSYNKENNLVVVKPSMWNNGVASSPSWSISKFDPKKHHENWMNIEDCYLVSKVYTMNEHEQLWPHLCLTRTTPKVPRGWFENCLVRLYTPHYDWMDHAWHSITQRCVFVCGPYVYNNEMLGSNSKFRSSHGNIPRAHITEAKHIIMLQTRCMVYRMLRISLFITSFHLFSVQPLKTMGVFPWNLWQYVWTSYNNWNNVLYDSWYWIHA